MRMPPHEDGIHYRKGEGIGGCVRYVSYLLRELLQRDALHIDIIDENGPVVRREDLVDAMYERGLPHAVGADDRYELGSVDLDFYILQDGCAGVSESYVVYLHFHAIT